MQSDNMAGAETSSNEPGINDLAEMLEEDQGAGAPEGDARGSDEDRPTKFNDLAGKLGLELDALYKLEVSQAEDGTPVTVEHLKDHYAKQGDLTLRELEFEERRTKQESELMQAQEDLRELMASLPEKAIKPEVLQKVREKHDAQMNLERKRTLEVIPEWNDEDVRTRDIEGMAEHLKQYGYPANQLERIADHRQIKYIRDNWQREQRIRKALEKVKAGKPNPTSKQKPAGKAPSKAPLSGIKRGNARNKLESVFATLE